MSADDIRVAFDTVTQTLHALHPDDDTYAAVEIGFGDRWAEAPPEIQDRACAPGGRRLVLGPTLAEIRSAFERGQSGEG